MNCEEVRELLPAYVLGVLDREEVDVLEIHLRSGHEHDEELVELRATVFALDRFADERSLDVAGERGQALPAHRPKRLGGRALPSWLAFDQAWHVAIAAIVVLAVFGTGWFVGHITGDRDEQDVTVLVRGPGGKLLSLSGGTAQDDVAVTMAGFEMLPSDRVYQLWAIRDGEWLRIGVCNPKDDGRWQGEFPFRLKSGEQIALTVEPAGGSEQPTSEPLLRSRS
jgi:anti-sigma-K factor RskA